MSNQIPKPLIKVNNKPMIETIIESLINNEVSEIYIVIGYMKEKFYYLKEKYSGINFIVNEDYESRGAISSFYQAKSILNDDFIISDGNLYVTDESIFNNKISHTTYLYKERNIQNDKWGLVLDEDSNYIKKIINPKDEGYTNKRLYGVSFWLKDDLQLLINEVEKEYKNPIYLNSIHDDLVNNIIDKLNIKAKLVLDNQIYELNSLADLVVVDKRYLEILKQEKEQKFNKVIELAEVLSMNSDELVGVYASPGRSTNNKNYVIETEDEKYFLRIAGEGTDLFSFRDIEKNAYNELKDSNIVDEVYFIDEESGMKISKFYEESRILNINNKKQLVKFIDKLKQIHFGDFDFIKKDNIFDRMLRYETFVKEAGGSKHFGKDMPKIIPQMYQYKAMFDDESKYIPIHGDCSPNNTMVLENGEVILIDLEFIQMGDPFTDLANFAHDGEMNEEQLINLLELYLDREATKEEKYKIFIFAATISVMWYSWAAYKMTVEPSELYKFKNYRDGYYDWYEIMYSAAQQYK